MLLHLLESMFIVSLFYTYHGLRLWSCVIATWGPP
jgi:hypothetical protein